MKIDLRGSDEFREAEPRRPRDPRPSKVLAVAQGGHWKALDHQGEDVQSEMEVDSIETLLHAPDIEGVVVWEGKLVDDGPGDWPGSREFVLDGTWRPATDEEWQRFRDGEFVWDEWFPEEDE